MTERDEEQEDWTYLSPKARADAHAVVNARLAQLVLRDPSEAPQTTVDSTPCRE